MMCCCRLHMWVPVSIHFPIIYQRPEREGKHNWVYMCIKKHKKKIPTTNCIHFSIFLSRTFSRKKRSEEKMCEGMAKKEEKNEIKIILCLCIYMDRIIKIMYTCKVFLSASQPLSRYQWRYLIIHLRLLPPRLHNERWLRSHGRRSVFM